MSINPVDPSYSVGSGGYPGKMTVEKVPGHADLEYVTKYDYDGNVMGHYFNYYDSSTKAWYACSDTRKDSQGNEVWSSRDIAFVVGTTCYPGTDIPQVTSGPFTSVQTVPGFGGSITYDFAHDRYYETGGVPPTTKEFVKQGVDSSGYLILQDPFNPGQYFLQDPQDTYSNTNGVPILYGPFDSKPKES